MSTRSISALILALSLVAGIGCDGETAAQQDAGVDSGPGTRHLVFFYTSDEHSHLFAHAPEIDDFPLPTTAGNGTLVGGVARRAALLAQGRATATAAGANTLTVSAGDQTQGALPQAAYTTSAPDFTLMKTLGYDVMCPGNHEFDRGPAAYATAIGAARAHGGLPPIVVSNIRFSDSDTTDDTLAALYGEGASDQPIKRYHVVITPSGIKVGFFGIVGVMASLEAPLKVPVRFSGDDAEEGKADLVLPKLYADLTPTVRALRETEKVDVVVALSHSGVNLDDPTAGEDYQIASNVAGIDLIISGHTHDPVEIPHLATGPDGHQVPIVQAGVFGPWLGRVELVLEPGARPALVADQTKTRLIPVDDRIVPADTAVNDALVAIIRDLEETPVAGGNQSFLEAALSRIEGTTVTDNPAVVGDLYYRVLGQTTFDVPGRTHVTETNGFNLAVDAMLTATEDVAGPTLMAVSGAGVIRADIVKGQTGDLTVADLYRVLPLGFNPVDDSVGYPLVRFYLMFAEIKAALELSAMHKGGGFFLVPSGLHVYYDTSRPVQDQTNPIEVLNAQNGRITRITVDTNHADGLDDEDVVMFDLSRVGHEWESPLGDHITIHPVVTNLYVAQYAASVGVTLKNASGHEITAIEAIVTRGDGSDQKDYEALLKYVRDECAANGGLLPSRYDGATLAGTVPRRMVCTGPACP
ncbi:MAG: bifunctional metallophosphatase/5'-nucleotidase [Deltaproteobacteria bacterium]|nr:bifunctional metallophosphatase/5'-nucleotidase [Deltaproteobacteria bacterium]